MCGQSIYEWPSRIEKGYFLCTFIIVNKSHWNKFDIFTCSKCVDPTKDVLLKRHRGIFNKVYSSAPFYWEIRDTFATLALATVYLPDASHQSHLVFAYSYNWRRNPALSLEDRLHFHHGTILETNPSNRFTRAPKTGTRRRRRSC